MKKATFIAAAIALLGVTSINANAQTATQATEQTQQDTNKEKVTQEQLPEPVKAVLSHETYKDWTVGDIYKVKPEKGAKAKALYEISLTNAAGQSGTLLLDEAGKDASAGK
ncbi:hypothetical protein [Pontibacter ruber]|uniref:PepSY domain-containing protein n=1 Tax=Pontibacter ruber TaxID=1343895 RepID=A0ABW5CYS4_9BACT|nr:hypothetical protein [Pontibacter ruber]